MKGSLREIASTCLFGGERAGRCLILSQPHFCSALARSFELRGGRFHQLFLSSTLSTPSRLGQTRSLRPLRPPLSFFVCKRTRKNTYQDKQRFCVPPLTP